MEIKGRDLVSCIPKTLILDDDEVRESLADPVAQILNGIKQALENTPPELSADIVDKGIVLAGGGALLKGMDVFLREENLAGCAGQAEDRVCAEGLGHCGQQLADVGWRRCR